ncbi:acyl-CoA-binding protein [Plasmodium gonderi]|uniref:Acyl-CoA-binding protein n=1 Tax=Plasmodium gonderi TaxID=77519 RepID=A0A1Y1JH26_PLAGO|nr:acyl-CoA-binding protein [Plasmodium gonderi]GAW80958.1 acyl-CoA-binding protein [Plasmodium gonderi]
MSINLNGKTILIANVASVCILVYVLKRYNPDQTNKILHKINEVTKLLLKVPQLIIQKCRGKKIIKLPIIDKNITINLSDEELDEKFTKLCNAVKMYKNQLNFEQWLYLYGLYKQITSGNIMLDTNNSGKYLNTELNEAKQTIISNKTENHQYLMDEKMNAWKNCYGVSKKVCKFLYVEFVEKLFPHALENEITNSSFEFTKTMSKMKPLTDIFTGGGMIDNSTHNNGQRHDEGNPYDESSLNNLIDLLCRNVVQENLEYIKGALKKNPHLINKRNSDGLCALHYACDRGYLDIVKLLVDLGADLNADDSCGDTALHIAAYSGKTDIINYLKNAGADINKKNSDGLTFSSILSQEMALY